MVANLPRHVEVVVEGFEVKNKVNGETERYRRR